MCASTPDASSDRYTYSHGDTLLLSTREREAPVGLVVEVPSRENRAGWVNQREQRRQVGIGHLPRNSDTVCDYRGPRETGSSLHLSCAGRRESTYRLRAHHLSTVGISDLVAQCAHHQVGPLRHKHNVGFCGLGDYARISGMKGSRRHSELSAARVGWANTKRWGVAAGDGAGDEVLLRSRWPELPENPKQ